MTDDKIIRLPTGYEPEDAPPAANDIQDLRWSIALLSDEITQLGTTVQRLAKALHVMNNKLNDIQRHIRKE